MPEWSQPSDLKRSQLKKGGCGRPFFGTAFMPSRLSQVSRLNRCLRYALQANTLEGFSAHDSHPPGGSGCVARDSLVG